MLAEGTKILCITNFVHNFRQKQPYKSKFAIRLATYAHKPTPEPENLFPHFICLSARAAVDPLDVIHNTPEPHRKTL